MDKNDAGSDAGSTGTKGFLASLLHGIIRDIVKLVVIFTLGTAGGAIVCLYYGFPLIYSLGGGVAIFVLATALLLSA